MMTLAELSAVLKITVEILTPAKPGRRQSFSNFILNIQRDSKGLFWTTAFQLCGNSAEFHLVEVREQELYMRLLGQ